MLNQIFTIQDERRKGWFFSLSAAAAAASAARGIERTVRLDLLARVAKNGEMLHHLVTERDWREKKETQRKDVATGPNQNPI